MPTLELLGPIPISATAPESASINDLWHDSSQTPPVLKFCASVGPVVFAPVDLVALNNKQAALVSGSTLKTVNGTSLLGSGNLAISGGASADLPLAKTAPTTDQVIPSGSSAYVVGPYEIVSGVQLEIEAGACLEIG